MVRPSSAEVERIMLLLCVVCGPAAADAVTERLARWSTSDAPHLSTHAGVLPHCVEWPASGIIHFSFDNPPTLSSEIASSAAWTSSCCPREYAFIIHYIRTNVGHGLTLVKAIVCTAAPTALAANRGTINQQMW
jgi:hypothetical protein